MFSGTAQEFASFAQDCLKLAKEAAAPELREKLMNLAEEWMQAAKDEEEPRTKRTGSSLSRPIPVGRSIAGLAES
jgi:hypothetical protein